MNKNYSKDMLLEAMDDVNCKIAKYRIEIKKAYEKSEFVPHILYELLGMYEHMLETIQEYKKNVLDE